jgi:hypothetical protein
MEIDRRIVLMFNGFFSVYPLFKEKCRLASNYDFGDLVIIPDYPSFLEILDFI